MNTVATPTPAASPQRRARPPLTGKILIVGGYGQVGQGIAARLAPQFPERVVVAGRNAAKARTAAAQIGHGAEGRALDLYAPDGLWELDGVGLVVVCLDQTDTRFVERCLAQGICYLDISADDAFLSRVERLDALAKAQQATALLSVGVAPGLSNLLAARLRAQMPETTQIDILLEFGLGDHHGPAAINWMFDNLDAAYEVRENHRTRRVRSFVEHRALRLPTQKADRPAYRFNFSDQHVIARTQDVASVSTWVRFEDRLSTWLFAKSSQLGLGRLLRRRWWRRVAVWLFMHVHLGSDRCGVAVRGRTADGRQTATLGVVGRKEALMTAIAAAESARQILTETPAPGVVHSDQVIALDPIVAALKDDIPDLVVR